MNTTIDDPDLAERLESAGQHELDALGFGVIAMDRTGSVVAYNAFESELSGLSADRVVGRNFFEAVGPCTNNFLVAQRFADEDELDETLDYVFTYRMRPTPVRLRMLARAGADRQFLLVERR